MCTLRVSVWEEAQDQGLKIFSVGRSTEGGQEAGMNGRRGTTKAIMQSGPGGQSRVG